MSSTIYLAIPVMLLLAILQTAVLPYFPLFDLTPQLPFLVALSWGVIRDSVNEGVVWGFVAGVFLDLFSITPLGLTSLAYMTAILGVMLLAKAIPTSRFLLPMILAGLGTAVYLILYYLLMRLFGVTLAPESVSRLPLLIVLHALLILPVYWLMHMLNRTFWPRRVEV